MMMEIKISMWDSEKSRNQDFLIYDTIMEINGGHTTPNILVVSTKMELSQIIPDHW